MIEIKILKLDNPGEFWAKEVKSDHMSEEGVEFEKLTRLINENFNSDEQVFGRILDPYQGQICIGKSRDDRKWYRVRIKHVMQSSHGGVATCFLLDHAEVCQINVLSLREPDPRFLELPYQAKKFVLHGIHPVSMVTDWASMTTSLQPANEWDISAREYVQKIFKNAKSIQAESMLKDDWGRTHIRLYITSNDGKTFCLNEHLVDKDYATKGVPLDAEGSMPATDKTGHGSMSRENHSIRDEPNLERRRADRRDTSSSGDELQRISRQTDRLRDMSDVKVTFRPAGKLDIHNARSRIPDPQNHRSSGNSGPTNSHSSGASAKKNAFPSSPPLQSGVPKPAGRAAFMMSMASKEKKPGHSSPPQNSVHTSPQQTGSDSSVNQSPTGGQVPRGRGQQLDAIKSHLTSPIKGPNSAPSLESISPVKTQPRPMGRGQKLLNLLPNIATSQASGFSKEQSQPDRSLSSRPTEPAAQNTEYASMSDSQEEEPFTPKRPRTPNSVRFSDADEILEPRQGNTPPSSDAKRPRSILKKSPSSDHDMSMDYALAERYFSPFSKKKSRWSSGEDSASDMPADGFRPSVRRPATDLLYQLKSGCMVDNRPTHVQCNVTPESEKVLFMGPTKPKAIFRLDEVPFGELMRKVLSDEGPPGVNKLASFAWTPIQRGLDVACVALRADWSLHTYIFPLVNQLQQRENYNDLPKGFGPRMIVLASSWLSARVVYDACLTTVREASRLTHSDVKVMLIFGGGNDQKMEVSLVNGCDILVATPHCLLRMLHNEFTSLNRVCHLVLEDADILTEEFTKQVKEIMELYQTTFKQQTERSAPKQLLTFSQKWTPSLTAFTRIYMNTSPTIIITKPTEAAIFSKVQLIPIACSHDDRMDRLLEILDTSLGEHTGRTLIFTSEKEARTLHEMLLCCSHYALLACSGLEDNKLNDVKRRWKSPQEPNSQLILVLTDEALQQIFYDITDATTVIHYQSPGFVNDRSTRRWLLGTRLWTMSKGFVNSVADKKTTSKCRSFLFLTEYTGEEAPHLLMLLQRLYLKVPEILQQRAEFFMKKVKKGQPNELCKFMKAFGKCRDEKKCPSRHVVFSSLDSPGVSSVYQKLPQHGEIKVYITHVRDDGSCFYGRLLEHTVNGKTTTLNAAYVDLTMRINMWFSTASRRTKCAIPQEGKLYAIDDQQHTFHRIETRKLSPVGHRGLSERACVYYVDVGREDIVKTEDMLELPEDLAKIKFQAVELLVCRVKPVDNDKEWTGQASADMSKLLYKKTLDGTILLSMANTLWLDPLVERERLQEVNIISTKYNVRTELINNGYGEENNQHLYLLYSACRDRLDLPDEIYNPEQSATKAYTVYGRPLEVAVESLSAHTPVQDSETWESEFVEVFVSAVSSPDLIYLQLANRQPLWLDLQEDLDTYVRLTDQQAIPDVKKGTLVMAKFPLEEDKWYRGKVMDIRSRQGSIEANPSVSESLTEVDVFFLDTGEQEWVSKDDLQPLDIRYLQLPFQAIEAIIMHLVPKEENWPESVSDFIWDFSRTDSEDPLPKKLFAKVISSGTARRIGSHHYGVELYDTSRMYSINLACHMVARGMADFSSEYKQDLFTVPETEDCYSKLATVCQVLAHMGSNNASTQEGDPQSKDATNTRIRLCEKLRNIVTENLEKSSTGSGNEEQVVSWLCTLLMCVWDELVVDTVCTVLTIMVSQSQDNLESVESRLDVTCELLDFTESHVIQKAVMGLWSALMVDIHCRQTLLSKGSARILCTILISSHDPEVLEACTDTVLLLITDIPAEQGILRVIGGSGLIPSVCKCLSSKGYKYEEDYSLKLSVQCVHILATLAKYPGLRDTLRKQGAVKDLCGLLGDPDTEAELVKVCVAALDRLSSNNRFNKDMMNTYNMINICGRLSRAEGLSKEVCDLCRSLQGRLESVKKSSLNSPPRKTQHSDELLNGVVPTSKTHIVQGLRLSVPQMPVQEAKPDIMWSQDKWNLLLRVQVKNVPEDQPVACFLPNSVKFRAVQEATKYKCELILYELIEPEECEVGVCAGEVRLGLRKSDKGRWPRLTKGKLKLPYIKVDFDRFIDSSESETEDEDSPIESPLSLVKRNVQRHVPFGCAEGSAHKKVQGNFNPKLLESSESSATDSSLSDPDRCYEEKDPDSFYI